MVLGKWSSNVWGREDGEHRRQCLSQHSQSTLASCMFNTSMSHQSTPPCHTNQHLHVTLLTYFSPSRSPPNTFIPNTSPYHHCTIHISSTPAHPPLSIFSLINPGHHATIPSTSPRLPTRQRQVREQETSLGNEAFADIGPWVRLCDTMSSPCTTQDKRSREY